MSEEPDFKNNGLSRRGLLGGAIGGLSLCGLSPLYAHADAQDFSGFLQSLWPLAEAKGVHRGTFDAAITGLTFDPATPSGASKQPEFDKPLQTYVANAVTPGRAARGRQEAAKWSGQLAVIETRFGVPGDILLAAWAVETDFGRDMGSKDLIRSLASLAYRRDDRSLFIDELIAALSILERGVPRDELKGSWAGAMGNPQFLPSAYLKYAVSFNGAGAPDIWTSVPDTLASIAHFLRESGWQPGLPWGMEVLLPVGFDYASMHMAFAAWARSNVRAADGRAFPSKGDATLFLPAGAGGPAFLLAENYWILKAYNNSDSYALSLALLADRIGGAGGLHGTWPAHEKIMSRADKSEVQRLLTEGGYYHGTIDGRFGPASRDAIHEFQRAAGLNPADGYGSESVLQALRKSLH